MSWNKSGNWQNSASAVQNADSLNENTDHLCVCFSLRSIEDEEEEYKRIENLCAEDARQDS